ncbi:MAG: hypothetical protein K2J25_04515, partial [Oscillospiraceae bacterium]|nr:hypothetical protein [Oscillospiraceae bacterium]
IEVTIDSLFQEESYNPYRQCLQFSCVKGTVFETIQKIESLNLPEIYYIKPCSCMQFMDCIYD